MKIWATVGAACGFFAVAFGAFGAHALSKRLGERALSVFHTGAQYQFYHALALIALAAWAGRSSSALLEASAWCFTLGILFFSGSLYALALTNIKILGAITPVGGTLFLMGWACL